MIDDRDEYLTRSGSRTRNAGDLEGQNVRTHDQGMRIRGSGRDREDTSRYGRSDDDRTGRSGRDEEWEMRQGRPYDDDRGYSWHQDRDPSRFDEGFRGRSWDETQRSARGPGDRGYGGRGDDRMHTSVDAGRGYREDRDLAGTSGRLGHDPERDYGRGGPMGGGSGYGGRQWEATDRERGSQHGGRGRDPSAGYGGAPEETREMYGGQRHFVRDDFGRGDQRFDRQGLSSERYGQHGRYDMGPGQHGQGQVGQGQVGQGQYGQGPQRSWRGEPQMGQRRGPLNYQRSDQRIYEDVCDRLSEDDELDVSNVEVKVDKGEVTITGHVESRGMKRRLEDVVERVSGVKDVHVQVKVQRQGQDQGRSSSTGAQTGTAAATGSAEKSAKPGPQGHTTT
jgi:hypothetical protein